MNPQPHTLPPPARPPHDPLHLLLDARIGWRALAAPGLEESPADQALCLSPKPGGGRALADAAGTFGGLDTPTGVAVDADGGIHLLDAASGKIKRFDPCECRFEEVPCTGGIGSAPRQFRDPHGIAIFCGDLFVCDTGNARLQVFALKGLTLRALWPSPAAADLPAPWAPYDIAFDPQGRAYVTDFANGVIHRFDRRGNWQLQFGALSNPTHLAVSGDGRVYVIQSGTSDVAVFDAEGKALGKLSLPQTSVTAFRPTGIATDLAGNLYLGDRCALHRFHCGPKGPPRHSGTLALPDDPTAIGFDAHGDLLVLSAAQKKALQFPITAFEPEGTYLSEPLDSALYRCQWHRVVLEGELPAGTSVKVETFTAEVPPDPAELQDPATTGWKTHQRATTLSRGAWDCLIASPPGRYLHLRLTLRGNGATTPRLHRLKLFFPRLSLRRHLPAVFGENPVSADFTDRMLSVFDTIFRSVESEVDNFARYLDPMSTPATRAPRTLVDFLTWLASWMGLVLDRSLTERQRRLFLREAWRLHELRGTLEGLRLQLLLFLGWPSPGARTSSCACGAEPPLLILEHFRLRRWLFVGEARLGAQSVLWGRSIVNRTQLDETARAGGTQLIATGDPVRDPFHVYAHKFSVFLPARCVATEDRRAAVERLIALAKPAHTVHQLELVGPRFRIGFQSTIGLDAVVGSYPRGSRLGADRLGYDTMVGRDHDGPPSLQVGVEARIGTTTVLD